MGMPLVMRYPAAVEPGQVSDRMVMNLDFAPTLLDYAGLAAPAAMQGDSFRGLLTRGGEWRQSVYYHYYEYPHGWHKVKRHCGVRTERHKLIHFYDDDIWELYDLENDPEEMNNLIADPAQAELITELKAELKRLQDKYGDTVGTG